MLLLVNNVFYAVSLLQDPSETLIHQLHRVLCKRNEGEIGEFRLTNCELSFQMKKRENFGALVV